LEAPPGFGWGGHDHDHGHDHGHGIEDGFNLRSVELTLSSTVDPYFDAQATVHFTSDDVEVEEAYVTTRMLPAGLQIKAGKFLSDVGYLNKQHTHDWLFADQPWLHEYFFGAEGLNEVGVQLSWLPPTETYLRLGVEVLQGESEGIASYIGEDGFAETDGPRLFTGFAKWAPDLGQNHAVQFGTFGGFSRAFQQEDHHDGEHLSWDGDAWFAGLDFVYKYDAGGAYGRGNFVLQGEYIYRQLDLDFAEDDHGHAGHDHQEWKQDGAYLQAVYGFAPRWNAGLRLDVLGLFNNEGYDHDDREDFGTSYRYTGQIAFAPSEFSQIRLQASYMDQEHGHGHGHGHDDHHDAWMFVLQFSTSLGVHGAHAF
jgi:hypothetical protein